MGDRVTRNNARFGERLIRPGGRVLWLGRYFVPEDGELPVSDFEALPAEDRVKWENQAKYDGRLDGLKALFYTYGDHHEASKNHIYLYSVGDEWPGPSCIRGVFCWETWRLEE